MGNSLTKQKLKTIGIKTAGTLAIPVIFVAVILIVCAANGRMILTTGDLFASFVCSTAVIMLTTMALSINLGSGRFDFSLGAIATLSSIISAQITHGMLNGAAGSGIVMLLLCIVFGVVLGCISGGLYVLLKIPPIITSLGITLIYEGVAFAITEGRYIMTEVQNDSMRMFRTSWYLPLLIIIAALVIIYIVFDHTNFGRKYNALKEGQNVAVNTGIKEIPNAIICYGICGALMGTVGFIQAASYTTINGGVLNFASIGVMFTAFLPMFIGGFIGRFSNDKLGYFLAAVCMALLSAMFSVYYDVLSQSTQSIITAVLLVVFLIFLNNEQTCKDLVTGRIFKKWAEKLKLKKATANEQKQPDETNKD